VRTPAVRAAATAAGDESRAAKIARRACIDASGMITSLMSLPQRSYFTS
jgi:hypothetical protein